MKTFGNINMFALLQLAAVSYGADATVADAAGVAEQILASSGVKGGLVVHLNCGNGELTGALRTGDENGVATPAGWEPGGQVIVPPPRTVADAARRTDNRDYDCRDWYFCKKDL